MPNPHECGAFIEENPTFVGVSESALRPLINETDPDIKVEAIQKVRSGVSKGQAMKVENIEHIIGGLKEGKVKSGRPAKNSNEEIKERDEEVDISKAIRPVEEAKAKKSVKSKTLNSNRNLYRNLYNVAMFYYTYCACINNICHVQISHARAVFAIGGIIMKTEEVGTSEITKVKIVGLLQAAKNYVWMSSGLNSEFYNDPDVKKAMRGAFKRVKEVKILIEGDAEEKKSKVGWLFEEAKKFKEKIRIRQCERALHWLIVDGKHFRLERPHPIGAVGVDNLLVYDMDPPVLSEALMRRFDEWWTRGIKVDP